MSVLDRLAGLSGVYWGEGNGPASGLFAVRVALSAHPDGTVTFDYEAWSPEAGLQHAESARVVRVGEDVMLFATSDGSGDVMAFREGDDGVFGSVGPERVGLVIDAPTGGEVTFSWWWPERDGSLREQSRAVVRCLRPLVAAPPAPGAGDVGELDGASEEPVAQEADPADVGRVPWPGILVLHGSGTGVVAQRLAERLTRAAVVRTDLFDKAVRGSSADALDPQLREHVALAVVRGYVDYGHPVILHGRSSRQQQSDLVDAIAAAGMHPVQLVDIADGEDYGEVARRLIETG